MGSHHPIRKTVAPAPVAIPDKLYFRIGDVAKLCDVPPYVLRFWETEFPQLKPNKGGTGQRLYRKKDVEMALRIKSLLYDQGYTIPGARQVFKSAAEPTAISPTEAPSAPDVASPLTEADAPHLAAAMWVPPATPQAEPYDRGPELRLRAQLADMRDDLQSLLDRLSHPTTSSSRPESSRSAGAVESPTAEPAPKPKPRQVLEPKPKPKPSAQATLHLTTQADLFPSE
jgi:DNA-binding transcriptional MerR regulator